VPLELVISGSADKPIYQQLFEQISTQILKGHLKEGSSLPPIRTVARELRISVIPVKAAWEELERAGFIITMAGKGCFVAPLKPADLSDKYEMKWHGSIKKETRFLQFTGIER
jgi:GntR family transcriptional regulator